MTTRLQLRQRFPADDAQLLRKLTEVLADHAEQINGLAEGRINAHYTAATSVPTVGTWAQGDFVRNLTPVEAGTASSKYVVTGWLRITSGSGNVLNTDWLATRALTGN